MPFTTHLPYEKRIRAQCHIQIRIEMELRSVPQLNLAWLVVSCWHLVLMLSSDLRNDKRNYEQKPLSVGLVRFSSFTILLVLAHHSNNKCKLSAQSSFRSKANGLINRPANEPSAPTRPINFILFIIINLMAMADDNCCLIYLWFVLIGHRPGQLHS